MQFQVKSLRLTTCHLQIINNFTYRKWISSLCTNTRIRYSFLLSYFLFPRSSGFLLFSVFKESHPVNFSLSGLFFKCLILICSSIEQANTSFDHKTWGLEVNDWLALKETPVSSSMRFPKEKNCEWQSGLPTNISSQRYEINWNRTKQKGRPQRTIGSSHLQSRYFLCYQQVSWKILSSSPTTGGSSHQTLWCNAFPVSFWSHH